MKTIFDPGNVDLGIPGTQVTADFLNALQNHRHDGGNNDGCFPSTYALDTGAVNACEITLVPLLTAHVEGMLIEFKVNITNTAAMTLKINALAAVPIKLPNGADLPASGLLAGQVCTVVYDGVNYQLVSTALASTNALPLAVAAAPGVSPTAARSDHVHPYPTPAQIGAAKISDNAFTGVQIFGKATFEKYAALATGEIDLEVANWFSKTIAANTTFSLVHIPAANTAAVFILDITNGGAFVITWWGNLKWKLGSAPLLTSAGRDVLGFYSYDAGATWTGIVIERDVK